MFTATPVAAAAAAAMPPDLDLSLSSGAPQEAAISDSNTASRRTAWHCGHTLHPSATQGCGLCPPCRTEQNLAQLHRMADYLKSKERPDALAEGYLPDPNRGCALRAYYAERLVFQHHIDRLQIMAERETKWEEEHPKVLRGCGYTDARRSLATIWNDMPFLDWRESDDGMPMWTRARIAKAKRARFAEDVAERPVRHKHCFARSHWRYTAGRWCAANGERWLDTSFWREAGYGTPEHEAVLDNVWDLSEEDCPDKKGDEGLDLKDIEEDGRLILAWLQDDELEGQLDNELSTERERADQTEKNNNC
jgi:hypothetical protein